MVERQANPGDNVELDREVRALRVYHYLEPINDAGLRRIIRRHFHFHTITDR
jgi:hypothetical protein